MSNITNYSASINEQFPVPGQDNDSQGFRDNFNNTKVALATADSEISDLQSKVVLTAKLSPDSGAVDNDLNGSTINNGTYNNFYGVAIPQGAAAGQKDISVTEASYQSFDLSGDTDFTFKNWPESGTYGVIRVQFVGPTSAAATPSFFTSGGGDIYKSFGFPSNFAVTLAKTTSGVQASGQNTLVLSNATDLAVGMVVNASGVQTSPVTTISNITGSTVTLSQNLTTSILNGATIHFSYPNGRVVEAWSYNGGATVYLNYIGAF